VEIVPEYRSNCHERRFTYDLLFFELFKICFWYLPTAWLILKEMKKVHEYQADAHALRSCDLDQYTTILIGSALKSNGLSLTSSFHDGLIFKRIKAMKEEVKKVSPWKLGVLGTLSMVLFMVFACSEESSQSEQDISTQSDIIKPSMEADVFTVVEELPQYPGGMDALYNYVMSEIQYPKEARVAGIQGLVQVQFVVEKNGTLSNVRVIDGIGAGCDQEAIRVVKNASTFTPGSQRGKTVRVQMTMPILFKLDLDKKNADKSAQGIIVIEKAEIKNGSLKADAHFSNGEWSGTIYSPEGDVLPGANILLVGTSSGTVSDLDGTFKIKANESQILQVSFVGYGSVSLEAR
jgi:TonB family protein